ncbi:DNA repair protein RadA [Thioalbus denitrificans]|uniref:DNA repair protein RadA n=1 Tax=Thioalbus denitrificans TaxID=547122 RepID=A0A369C6N0_9GAMM|nr:DNA repair protein RadA [Thioalbus denitrificans]RCX28267.1 DNA replication and repair protein RadA [Thioalbus denitrificans]
MAKQKISYCCTECGAQSPKWAGQCPDCGGWNTLVEVAEEGVARGPRFAGYAGALSEVKRLEDVSLEAEPRLPTGLVELDRVLGGGLVAGSVVLIGGDPGIGKSTLLSQALAHLGTGHPCLYITGEESLQQVALRVRRLGLPDAGLRLLAETRVERMLQVLEQERPQVAVVDSIQTVYTEQLSSAPGSVAQVRDSAAGLVRFAKQTGTALFLVGHVTKEGTLAGPRVLEHMVDTVLYFEGERGARFRVIRAVKNRFGAVNELGVFAMSDRGLKEVSNPSAIFLSGFEASVPGSVIMATWEGSRPLLVEVQALVDQSHLGNPRRLTLGFDQNRIAMLLAVLHRHGGVATFDQDVFVNMVGGVRVTETGADLPVLLAVLSSLRNRPLPEGLAAFGEVGLSGEIRPVQGGQERLREAAKHGFRRVLMPRANAPKRAPPGVEVVAVQRLAEAIDAIG